jgi:para-aminobenzoate synthetase component 1
MNFAVLERGFLGERKTFKVEKIKTFRKTEEFFKYIENSKGKLLLLYISFEGGYPFLNLPERKTLFPNFLVAELGEEIEPPKVKPFSVSFKGQSLGKEEYLKRFEKIKRYIERGDIYQVNFTVRFDFFLEGDPFSLYKSFIETQPVPYGVFLKAYDFFLLSGSMELFLKKGSKKLISKPIKGTLPKDADPSEFFKLEKELAENLMITDMVRNDLGRVAKYGTVKVEKLFGVETYNTLHQLVSTVSCETDKGFKEIIENTFPPASVTGAPKRRAVEIIAELEPHTREVYCGTIGVIKPNGDFTCNVAIRTAFGRKNELFYYAGGGIVYDSQPLKEWNEVLLKMEAFLKATKKGKNN